MGLPESVPRSTYDLGVPLVTLRASCVDLRLSDLAHGTRQLVARRHGTCKTHWPAWSFWQVLPFAGG